MWLGELFAPAVMGVVLMRKKAGPVVVLVVIVLLVVLIVYLGATGGVGGSVTSSVNLGPERVWVNDAVTLWYDGNEDAALRVFLHDDYAGLGPITHLECLVITEREYVQRVNRFFGGSALQEEKLEAGASMRALARAVVARIEEARAAGDIDTAAEWEGRLHKMAQQLRSQEMLLNFQQQGEIIEKNIMSPAPDGAED